MWMMGLNEHLAATLCVRGQSLQVLADADRWHALSMEHGNERHVSGQRLGLLQWKQLLEDARQYRDDRIAAVSDVVRVSELPVDVLLLLFVDGQQRGEVGGGHGRVLRLTTRGGG